MAFLYVIPAVFALFGIGIIVRYAWLDQRWFEGFQGRAVLTDATVTGARAMARLDGGGTGASRGPASYQAKVRLTLADGSERDARTRYAAPTCPPAGDTLAVRYDPEDPGKVVHAEGPGAAPPKRGLVIAGGVLALVMAYVFYALVSVFV